MGEIIEINFRAELQAKQPKMVRSKMLNALPGVDQVSLNELNNALQGSGVGTLLVALRIKQHLLSLDGPQSSKFAILTHRKGLEGYTFAELSEIAEKSTPDQWTRDPAYYIALIQEIGAKGSLLQ